jgi:hypothetical protein
MHNVGAALAVTLVSAAQLAGCSSSKGITSLDPDKKLSSLTTEERRQYCEDRYHYMTSRVPKDDRHKIDCSVSAADVGTSGAAITDKERSACQEVYQACVGLPAPEPQSSCDDFPKNAADCTATVGDVDTCAVAQADALEKLAAGADATCSRLDRARQGKDRPSKAPAECTKVQQLCPKLFDEPALDAGKP